MEVHYYNLNEDKFVRFHSEEVDELIFELNQLDYSENFQLNLIKEHHALVLFKDDLLQGVFHEVTDNKEYQTGLKINSLLQLKELTISFIKAQTHQEISSLIEEFKEINNRIQKEKFNQWKLNYEKSKKENKRINILPVAISLITVAFLFSVFVFLSKNFINQDDQPIIIQKEAKILREYTSSGKRGSFQIQTILLTVDDIDYKISHREYDEERFKKIGETVFVQFDSLNPKNSECLKIKY
jgi:hypothetical protein